MKLIPLLVVLALLAGLCYLMAAIILGLSR
jgi:ABC-type multidrug transport system permease subunit